MIDPRCYFICNRGAPLQNAAGTGIATDLSCISDISGIFMAEANFVLNVVNECDISTSFEGFSLYGQFHTDISLGNPPGGSGGITAGDLGVSNWTMKNVGLSESQNSFTLDNNYNGDLLLSHSNLDSISQTSNGRNISWQQGATTPPDISASTSYSFPVTFRKPVQLPNNPETPLYLGLTLIRCPSEIDDNSWNNWTTDANGGQDYTISLSHPLPFRYYITYTPAQTAEWQGQRGFSTNLSITPL